MINVQLAAEVATTSESLAARLFRGEAHRATVVEAATLLQAATSSRPRTADSAINGWPNTGDVGEACSAWVEGATSIDAATIKNWLKKGGGEALRSDVRAALEDALNFAEPRSAAEFIVEPSTRRLVAEDLRQAMMLGTDKSAGVRLCRLQGRDPAQGRWIDRGRLESFLTERCAVRRRRWSLLLTLALVAAFAVSASQHLRAQDSGELGRAVVVSLGRPASLADALPNSLWTWLAADSLVAPDLAASGAATGARLVGGIRVARLPASGVVEESDVLCPYSVTHFIQDVLRGALSQDARPGSCGGERGGNNSIKGQPRWVRGPPLTAQALSQARDAFGEEQDVGFELRLVARAVPGGGGGGDDSARLYAVASAAVRIDLGIDSSGLAEESLEVTAVDASPVWPTVHELEREGDVARVAAMAADMFFAVLLIGLGVSKIVSLCLTCRSVGCLAALHRCPTTACVVDCCTVAAGVVLILLYGYFEHSAKGLDQLVLDLEEAHCATDDKCLDAVLEQADRTASARGAVFYCFAVVALCLWLRFVRDLQAASQQFAIMVRALARAASELACLVIAAAPPLAALVLAAHLLFGGRVEAFAEINTALASTTLVVAGRGGLGVRAELHEEAGAAGFLWLWLLLTTAVVLLLRLALVVLLVAYLEVRAGSFPGGDALRHGELQACLRDATRERAPPWPSLPKPPLETQRRAEVRKAMREFCCKRLLRWLADDGGTAPREQLVSSQQLVETLGAHTWGAQAWLHFLLRSAGALDAEDEAEALAADTPEVGTLRLYGRLDANVQDLLQRLRGLGDLVPSLTLGRAGDGFAGAEDDEEDEGDVGVAACGQSLRRQSRPAAAAAAAIASAALSPGDDDAEGLADGPTEKAGGGGGAAAGGLIASLAAASASAAPTAAAAATSAVASVSVSVAGAVAAASAASAAAVEAVRNPHAAATAAAGRAAAATAAAAASTAAAARAAVDVGAALADTATDLAAPVTSTLAELGERARGAAASAAAATGLGGGAAAAAPPRAVTPPSELQQQVERRLLELDQQDAARCADFEARLLSLAQQLEAAELELYARNAEREDKFHSLEVDVEALIKKVAPLYNSL